MNDMSYDWLNDKYVKRWFAQKSKTTQENYKRNFPRWLRFIKMLPTEQIEKRCKDLASEDLTERTWFEDKLRQFKKALVNEGLKPNSVKTYLTCVASFFSSLNVHLRMERGFFTVEVPDKVMKETWIPRNTEIRVAYKHCPSSRDRALLLVLYQSGFSESDVEALNIEDLNNIYEHEGHLYIKKRREKTNVVQATCISEEALEDIKAMLHERGNPKTGALFLSEKGKRLTVRWINEAIKNIFKKAYPERKFSTKNLRDSYNSALLRARNQGKLGDEVKDILFGHKRMGARGHYAFDKQTILEAYEMVFPYLSINHGTQEKIALKEIKKDLENQFKKMDKLTDMLNEERERRKQLEDQIALITEKIAERDSELYNDILAEINNANKPIIQRIQRIEAMLKIGE